MNNAHATSPTRELASSKEVIELQRRAITDTLRQNGKMLEPGISKEEYVEIQLKDLDQIADTLTTAQGILIGTLASVVVSGACIAIATRKMGKYYGRTKAAGGIGGVPFGASRRTDSSGPRGGRGASGSVRT